MAFICIEIPAILQPSDLEIILPGGIGVRPSMSPFNIRRPSDLVMDVLGQAQPALAAFQPVLDIVGVLEALASCIQAIPDAIATLDPSKISACVSGLNAAMMKILMYVPQMSLPLSAMKMVGLVIIVLEDLRALLVDLQTATAQADAALLLGQQRNDETLIAIANCAKNNIDRDKEKAVTLIQMLGAPIRIINVVLQILGQPCILLSVDSSLGLDGLIALIDLLLGFLHGIQIPIPYFPAGPAGCSKYMVYNPLTGKLEVQNA